MTPTRAAQEALQSMARMSVLASIRLEQALTELCSGAGNASEAIRYTTAALNCLTKLSEAQGAVNAMRDGGRD